MATIEEQLVDSSKMLADIIVNKIGNNKQQFSEAIELMLKDKYPISMRAGRIVHFVSEKHPHLVAPYYERMVNLLPTARVDGVKRSIQKIMYETPYDLTEEMWGKLTDISFNFIEDPKQAIAIRAFAIDFIVKTLNIYPEIKPELIALLESVRIDCSVGLENKCRKLIQKLKSNK